MKQILCILSTGRHWDNMEVYPRILIHPELPNTKNGLERYRTSKFYKISYFNVTFLISILITIKMNF